MTDKSKKYLSDILRAIELIEDFIAETDDFDSYINDFKTQSAVERQLGIIGEAVNKYNNLEPDSVLSDTKKIVGFRNRLIHSYDSIDNSIIWAVLKKHLTPLKKEVIEKLGE